MESAVNKLIEEIEKDFIDLPAVARRAAAEGFWFAVTVMNSYKSKGYPEGNMMVKLAEIQKRLRG